MSTLTIFTPAYNRAHTIGRTYESLCRQTCHDCEWLIVDDGSKDNTKELVLSWLRKDSKFQKVSDNEYIGYAMDSDWLKIHYVYKENGGMHTAHNTAYEHIFTELNTCIDSDDYMPDDAVEKIVKFWNSQSKEDKVKYAGIMGLDYADGGGLIGNEFPAGMKSTTVYGYYKSGGKGDKKMVYRTDVIKKYPKYPVFEGEKYVSVGLKYQMIDVDYELLVLNEPLVIVDYQLDGSSYNMYKQYWNNPKGFAFMHNNDILYTDSLKRKIQVSTHFVAHSLRAKDWGFLKKANAPFITICCIPCGIMLYWYTWYKVKTGAYMMKKK